MMNRNYTAAGLLAFASLTAFANQQPTSNDNPTYAPSHVQAHLRLNIRENADTVHFIRDTNDPKIITKTYVLKHADPYSIRPYIREMVQVLRVDYNNVAGRLNPDYYNVYSKDSADKSKKIFVPTGVECIRFTDGTGILMVAAEEYRFRDHPAGLGIDSLVAKLDRPGIVHSSGQPKYIYFPANRPAKELLTMVKLVGANVSDDTVELIGGKDKIELDEELNCLFLNTALYSRKNVEEMLRAYDVPHPEIRIGCTVYELDAENDGMLGLDFQSWKNNDGVRFFSTGAKWSRNYNIKDVFNLVKPDGTVNSHYFNFEPKWNSKYLDFLVSKGKAKVVSTGELAVKNGVTGTLKRVSGTMYAKATPIPKETKPSDNNDIPEDEHGNRIDILPDNASFLFELAVTPSVTDQAASLNIAVSTVSMLGYTSTGSIRSSRYQSKQKVMLGTGRNRLYLGGIEKVQMVSDTVGLPFFKDLPLLGFLFTTERDSTKRSRLVVVAECEVIQPGSLPETGDLEKIRAVAEKTGKANDWNAFGYRQYLIDPDRN